MVLKKFPQISFVRVEMWARKSSIFYHGELKFYISETRVYLSAHTKTSAAKSNFFTIFIWLEKNAWFCGSGNLK